MALPARANTRACGASEWQYPPAEETPPNPLLDTSSDRTHRLTVNVRMNGHGPFRFLVDTGADRSVVAAEVAAAIGLNLGDAVTLRGAVRAIPTETVLVKELNVGSIRCRDLLLPVLPGTLLGADGYLGLDALDRHRVIFDFKLRTLQVTAPHSRLSAFFMAPNEVRVRTAGTLGHLRATHCLVDGVAAGAFLDTGAELSAGNTALFDALVRRNAEKKSLGDVSLTDVTGGEISGMAMIVRDIQLDELTFKNSPLVIADFEVFSVWGLRDRPALLIGVNFLRQFSRVSIDYGLNELRFDTARIVQGNPETA